jgi:hypothetical protein
MLWPLEAWQVSALPSNTRAARDSDSLNGRKLWVPSSEWSEGRDPTNAGRVPRPRDAYWARARIISPGRRASNPASPGVGNAAAKGRRDRSADPNLGARQMNGPKYFDVVSVLGAIEPTGSTGYTRGFWDRSKPARERRGPMKRDMPVT